MGLLSGAIHLAGDVASPVLHGVAGVDNLFGDTTSANRATGVANAIASPNQVFTGNVSSALQPNSGGSFSPSYNAPQVLGAQTHTPNGGTSPGQQPSGAYPTGGGTGSGTDYSANIGSLDSQIANLRGTLGTADTTLSSGLKNILDDYTKQRTAADLANTRATEDFNTTTQNDNTNHAQAIDGVNTKARTLANSVRQMIGNAGGSGSSAYQIAAPDAVARQANLQSQDINNNFGQNMTALTTAKQRQDQNHTLDMANLADTLTKNQNNLRTGIENEKQTINGELADFAAQRAAYAGGGVAGANAAAKPFTDQAAVAGTAIKGIADGYTSPFATFTPHTVAAPTLRDYVTGQQSVSADPNATSNGAAPATTPTYNPLASWLKQNQDQNQYAI